MELWEGLGVPKSKLLVGLAFYGRTWTLSSASNIVGAPGSAGNPTALQEAGIIAYAEVQQNAWPETWDSTASVPYAVKGNQWVSYESPKSLDIKVNFTCITKKYPGVLIWDLAMDPQASLLTKVHNGISTRCSGGNGATVPPPTSGPTTTRKTTTASVTGTTRPPTTIIGGGSCGDLTSICSGASFGDLRPYAPDCAKFVNCVNPPVIQNCPSGLQWNGIACDWPANVQCPSC